MSSIRKLIQNILPNTKIYYRLQELLNSTTDVSNQDRIQLSIEKTNHSREYCELNLKELELLYVLYPKCDRCFYECISQNQIIKTYIDFEYLLEHNSSVDHKKAVLSCLKILYFYLNGLSQSSTSNTIDLLAILKQFLVLNAYVFTFFIYLKFETFFLTYHILSI